MVKGKRPIVIADPDARVASLAAHALRKEGYKVITAQRGEEALALLTCEPSIIFSEVEIPGVDGLSLCKTAKLDPSTRHIPFFLLSQHRDRILVQQARAAGVDDFLEKPVYVRDICTLAHLFFGRQASESLLPGSLENTPFFYLLRALTSGIRSGSVEAPSEQASVHFQEGFIVNASAGALENEAALGRLLLLSHGSFELNFKEIISQRSINYSLRDLVTYDEPRRQRFERAVAIMGGPESRFIINFAVLARELPGIPPSLEKTIRLFDGRRTLSEALRVSNLDEISTAEAIQELRARGILVPESVGARVERSFPEVSDSSMIGWNIQQIKLRDSIVIRNPKYNEQGLRAPSPVLTHTSSIAYQHDEQEKLEIEQNSLSRDAIGQFSSITFAESIPPCIDAGRLEIQKPSEPDRRLEFFNQLSQSDSKCAANAEIEPSMLDDTRKLKPEDLASKEAVASSSVLKARKSRPISTFFLALASVAILSSIGLAGTKLAKHSGLVMPNQAVLSGNKFAKVDLDSKTTFQRVGPINNFEIQSEPVPPSESTLTNSIRLEAKGINAYYVLGAAYLELGNLSMARSSFKKYLELAPQGEHSAEVREILSGLK